MPQGVVRDLARRTFDEVAGNDSVLVRLRRDFGMQSSWEAFIRDTHPITDQNECIRLGDALDSQLGLLSDELQ